jgi:anaphase-promoting complex subunit 6
MTNNFIFRVLSKDPWNLGCMPLFITCLYELKEKTKLFKLAHDLVEVYADKPVSWFAVGVYYLLCGRSADARKYFR